MAARFLDACFAKSADGLRSFLGGLYDVVQPEALMLLSARELELQLCGAPVVEWEYEVLSETPNGRIVYSCREEGDGIQSIPHVAAKHIGDGLLMQAERRGAQNQWRLLISDDDTVSEIYEEVKDSLSDGLSLSVQRISEPECWLEESVSADGLPPEQQAALEAASSMDGMGRGQAAAQERNEAEPIPVAALGPRAPAPGDFDGDEQRVHLHTGHPSCGM